jgi:hypothetical protein
MKNTKTYYTGVITDTYNALNALERKQQKARDRANLVRVDYLQENNVGDATRKLKVRSKLMDKVHTLNEKQIRLTYQLLGKQEEARTIETQEEKEYIYFANHYNYAV